MPNNEVNAFVLFGDELEIADAKARNDISTINTQLGDISNQLNGLKLVAENNNIIKLMLGTRELSSITITGGIAESKPCTNITLNTNTLTFTNLGTQTLIATPTPSNTTDVIEWNVTPTGIATVINGVVTPVSNGQCKITVTCGSQSATCNVTVSGLTHSIIQLTEITNTIPLTSGYKLNDSTGVEESKDGCLISYFIKVTEGQNLTYSVTGGNYLRVFGYDNNFSLSNKIVFGGDPGNSTTFTIPSNTTYIRLQSFNGQSPATITVN